MSSTPTIICNMALDHIGEKNIASIDDNSRQAQKCKQWYPTALTTLLEEHKFGFAEKRIALAPISDAIYDPTVNTMYSKAYAYPSDCLVANEIYNESSALANAKVPFILQANTALDAIYILTDVESAVLIYTAATESFVSMKSGLFQRALSHRLATLIAMPLTKDAKIRDDNANYDFGISGQSKTKDSNEQHLDEDKDNFSEYIDIQQ